MKNPPANFCERMDAASLKQKPPRKPSPAEQAKQEKLNSKVDSVLEAFGNTTCIVVGGLKHQRFIIFDYETQLYDVAELLMKMSKYVKTGETKQTARGFDVPVLPTRLPCGNLCVEKINMLLDEVEQLGGASLALAWVDAEGGHFRSVDLSVQRTFDLFATVVTDEMALEISCYDVFLNKE